MRVHLTSTGLIRPRVVVWMPDAATKQRLEQWCNKLGIPRSEAPPFHMTIIYSKNGLPHKGLVKPFSAFPVTVPKRAIKYKMLGRDKSKTLTLYCDSDAARIRNKQYMDAGAISDFPHYTPHVSLSNWRIPWKGVLRKLPPVDFQIVFSYEADWEHVKAETAT